MENKKLKEFKLTKKAKYGIATMSLAAVLAVGVASFAMEGDDQVVNNNTNDDQQVVVPPEDKPSDNDNVQVIEPEKLARPFTVNAEIKTYYFDVNDTSKNQEKALIYYNGMYTPSLGLDYFYNNLAFDVVSVFSGTVIEKKVDPLYGVSVSVKSDEGNLVAVYSSLSNVSVNKGDKVNQGQVIAKAGNNTINSNLGNHLNFSLLKNNKNINPLDYYQKEIKNI